MTGPIPAALWALTAIAGIVLLVRDGTRRWVITALPAVIGGAILGVGVVWYCNAADVFGVPLPHGTGWWMSLAGGGVGLGIATMWRSPWWRKALAALLIVMAPLSAAIGINAGFGLTPTIGDVFGVNTLPSVGRLPPATGHRARPASEPLYRTWRPPATMPKVGRVGTLSGALKIPSTGGFVPRDATIYLPPAALVPNAPALPLVVMMNGKPGSPNPSHVQAALNRLAAAHHGLAPIVIVADQLGSPGHQPACSPYSQFGNVSRYFNSDIVRYARTHLNIIDDPADFTIAGYSDGGACAVKWASEYPKIWGNVISISGDLFPGASDPATALKEGFRGSKAHDLSQRPAVFVTANAGRFAGHHAFFTGGSLDPRFSGYALRNAEMLQRAGFGVWLHEITGATHVGTALSGGLLAAFGQLYPLLGLAPAR
ncbi:alpha/beta hydrolase [Microbacterium kribbense]